MFGFAKTPQRPKGIYLSYFINIANSSVLKVWSPYVCVLQETHIVHVLNMIYLAMGCSPLQRGHIPIEVTSHSAIRSDVLCKIKIARNTIQVVAFRGLVYCCQQLCTVCNTCCTVHVHVFCLMHIFEVLQGISNKGIFFFDILVICMEVPYCQSCEYTKESFIIFVCSAPHASGKQRRRTPALRKTASAHSNRKRVTVSFDCFSNKVPFGGLQVA